MKKEERKKKKDIDRNMVVNKQTIERQHFSFFIFHFSFEKHRLLP